MPRTVMGYVLRFTGAHQTGLAALSIAVFLLSTAPLELQRRIVNDLVGKGSARVSEVSSGGEVRFPSRP